MSGIVLAGLLGLPEAYIHGRMTCKDLQKCLA